MHPPPTHTHMYMCMHMCMPRERERVCESPDEQVGRPSHCSQIGGAPLAAPRGHLSGNGAGGTHGGGKKKPSNAKKNQHARAAAGPRGARPSTLLRAQGRLMASGTLSLTPSTKELQFALDRWERRNDSDASSRSTHNFSHKSLEPSERGSDDCPILRRFVHRRTHDAESQSSGHLGSLAPLRERRQLQIPELCVVHFLPFHASVYVLIKGEGP